MGIFVFVFVLGFSEVGGLCSFSCARQTNRPITAVVGPRLGEVASFSCKTPSIVYIKEEPNECYARAGKFIVLQRRKNEYACFKVLKTAENLLVFYRKWYRCYLKRPTLCEVCSAPDKWTYNVYVEVGNKDALMQAMNLKQSPIGCTLPKNCPIKNPFTDFPCSGCEAPVDNGHCCAGCYQPKWK